LLASGYFTGFFPYLSANVFCRPLDLILIIYILLKKWKWPAFTSDKEAGAAILTNGRNSSVR
jgi:hypothetical protein